MNGNLERSLAQHSEFFPSLIKSSSFSKFPLKSCNTHTNISSSLGVCKEHLHLSDYHYLLKHFNLPSEALLGEYRLTVLENKVLRRIFGPNKEVTKGKPNVIGGD
jgi:hypothetical protein